VPVEGILGATLAPSAICAMAVTPQRADVRHVGNPRPRTASSCARRADAVGVTRTLLMLLCSLLTGANSNWSTQALSQHTKGPGTLAKHPYPHSTYPNSYPHRWPSFHDCHGRGSL
jgi:hypothetical protein